MNNTIRKIFNPHAFYNYLVILTIYMFFAIGIVSTMPKINLGTILISLSLVNYGILFSYLNIDFTLTYGLEVGFSILNLLILFVIVLLYTYLLGKIKLFLPYIISAIIGLGGIIVFSMFGVSY